MIRNTVQGLFFAWVCCLTLPSFSQIDQPGRFEKERKFNEEDFSIIPLQEDGIVLIRERNKFKSGNQFWDVIFLDSTLQENGTLDLELDSQNKLIGYDHAPGFVYILFNRKAYRGEMELLAIHVASKEVSRHEIKPELNFQITQFCKAGDNFVFGGYVNTESAVLLYSPANKNVTVVPGFFYKNIELIDMRANTNQTFNTLLIDRSQRDNQKIIFRTFDSSGKQLLENITEVDPEISLQNGISSSLEREDLMIIGTWSKKNSKQASGFYTLRVDPFNKEPIKRVHFGELNHYLDYLKPKKAERIKLRTKEALEAGKIPDFTNHVMPFKIVEHEKGFLVFAESFNPSSSYQQNNTQYPYGTYPPYSIYSPYGPYGYFPSNRGYHPLYNYGDNVTNEETAKIVHGAVLNFDATGNTVWDFSIKLDEIKRSTLEQNADFQVVKNGVVIFYKKESDLVSRKLDFEKQEVTEATEPIRLKDAGDEVRSENSSGIVKHWFGSNFYVWGYQTIRNKSSANRTRDVFFINKVAIR